MHRPKSRPCLQPPSQSHSCASRYPILAGTYKVRLTQQIPYKSYPNFLLGSTVSPPKIVSRAAAPICGGVVRRAESIAMARISVSLVGRSYEKPFEPC